MLKRLFSWLKKKWWGIIVTYGLAFTSSLFLIWEFAEPLGLVDNLKEYTFLTSRWFVLIVSSLLIGSHLTLVLDIILRRSTWSSNGKAILDINQSKDELIEQHMAFVTAIRRLGHIQGDFVINEWSILHSIDEQGNDFLEEKLTILPLSESVYFYFKGYSFPNNDKSSSIDFSARNIDDDTPLTILELEQDIEKAYFAVLLDSPCTPLTPKRIELKCKRLGLWKKLIKNGRDEGILTTTNMANSIEVEIIAPINKTWKSFHPAPSIGEWKTYSTNSHSSIIWKINNPTPRQYTYEVFFDQ